MEPLNRAAARHPDDPAPEHLAPGYLAPQVSAYLAASNVPEQRRATIADDVVAALPDGLDGPHLWQAIQGLVDRALARDEALRATGDRRLLARARLSYVLGPDGSHLTLPEAKAETPAPLPEDDRFSVPRPVRREMKQQPLAFWKLASMRAWKRKSRLGTSLKRETR